MIDSSSTTIEPGLAALRRLFGGSGPAPARFAQDDAQTSANAASPFRQILDSARQNSGASPTGADKSSSATAGLDTAPLFNSLNYQADPSITKYTSNYFNPEDWPSLTTTQKLANAVGGTINGLQEWAGANGFGRAPEYWVNVQGMDIPAKTLVMWSKTMNREELQAKVQDTLGQWKNLGGGRGVPFAEMLRAYPNQGDPHYGIAQLDFTGQWKNEPGYCGNPMPDGLKQTING